MECPNGHDNSDEQKFCGSCGLRIVPAPVCPHGHETPAEQRFCGDCGAPVAAPEELDAPDGRWREDPTGEHQYRYFTGRGWTAHVYDRETSLSDPVPPTITPIPVKDDKWIMRAAAVSMTVISGLLIFAAYTAAQSIQSSEQNPPVAEAPAPAPAATAPQTSTGDPHPAAATESPIPTTSAPATSATTTTTTTSAPTTTSTSPAAPTPTPTAAAAVAPVAVIGKRCRPDSSDFTTADGSTAYCVRVQGSDTTLWSLRPGQLRVDALLSAYANDPSVAVCALQTSRSADGCIEYLQRPSYPGNGHP